MKVLVVGGGGREHALAWRLASSMNVEKVFVAPGNPGMSFDQRIEVTGIPAGDFHGIADFCAKESVGFVVVGPDQALADGIVDFLEPKGLKVFGPKKAAARLESSKAFAKEVMESARIPTARYKVFSDWPTAKKFLETVEWGTGWVIKADGLALGKGVVVCADRGEALKTAEDFLAGGAMGDAGKSIVVEERLIGRETSGFFLCDGMRAVCVGFACDYKRIFDGDKGPNTGGMGAFSPADWMPAGMELKVRDEIVLPLLAEMKKRGAEYRGVLFAGLMITDHGPKVIEFNARFGDPETQCLLPLLAEDFLPWLQKTADGELPETVTTLEKKNGTHSVHVVFAAEGYPGANVRKGDPIAFPSVLTGLNAFDSGAKAFFAGVAKSSDGLTTNGGRVLGVTALAQKRATARSEAYNFAEKIRFNGMQRRNDVGAE